MPSDANPATSLEKIAVEKGWATPEQIKAAVRYQAQKKVSISQALVALGILTEVQVRRAIGGRKAPPPPSTAPHPLANAIKGYRIDRRLGSGGMGDVYLAQQTSLQRPVALKILPPHLAKDEEFIERFVTEARAAGKVSHENIVAAVDVGESNGRYFFVMELIEGPTLQQTIQKEGALPEKRALDIARQVARGLKHAYGQGLIHRDIKPANIMLASDNVAKICDFGLARELDAEVTLTMPGIVQSSPAYASPEQCRGRQDLDHRTDMYSLGVTLFEMLTGKRPFQAESASALFIKHATEAPPAPQSLNPAITAGANQLALRLLKKEPKQRFETYDQLIEAIDGVEKSRAMPKLKIAAAARPVPVKKSGFPWAVAVAGVLLLGAAAGLFVALRKPPPPAPAPQPEAKAKPAVDPEVERLRKSMADLEQKMKERETEKLAPKPEPEGPVKATPQPPKPDLSAEAKNKGAKAEPVEPKPEPQARVTVKVPPPVVPNEHVRVLRTASRRADPRERDRAAGVFRATAMRSALHRAAEVFLSRDEKHWKLGAPAAKALDEYLAALPIDRADSISTADHQGQFVALAKRIADLGETPKDPLLLFALAHADELLAQNVRPDAEGIRLCRFQSARTADFWGPPATVNRLALARLLAGQGPPADLQRTEDAVAATPDFPSRLLCALSALKEKDIDPTAAASTWKRLASMAPGTPAGKFCEQVSDRFKKASACDGCSGQGKYPCKKCSAAGIADCDKCKGSGRIREDDRGGLSYGGMIPCPGCKQKGRVICPVCQGGKVARCQKCEGKKLRKTVPAADFQDVLGAHACGTCAGTGGVFARAAFPCQDCDGTGRFPSK